MERRKTHARFFLVPSRLTPFSAGKRDAFRTSILSLFLWFALALALGRFWWWGVRLGGVTGLLMMLRWPGRSSRVALVRGVIRGLFRGMISLRWFVCRSGPVLVHRVLMGLGLDGSSLSLALHRGSLRRVPPMPGRGNLSPRLLVLLRGSLSGGFVAWLRVRLRRGFLAVRRGSLIPSRGPVLVSAYRTLSRSGRMAVIGREMLVRIMKSRLFMFALRTGGLGVPLLPCGLLRGGWSYRNPTRAVKAGPVRGSSVVNHCTVNISVVHDGIVHPPNRGVVVKGVALPPAAIKP
jgi:hypothetical protein